MTKEQELLNEAAEEIYRLRQVNEKMNIRLTAFDDMMYLMKSHQPERREGFGLVEQDIVSRIDEHLNENAEALSNFVRKQVNKRR